MAWKAISRGAHLTMPRVPCYLSSKRAASQFTLQQTFAAPTLSQKRERMGHPPVLAITLNTFIVYTSNIFAILGLRSLFFALSSLMDIFKYLHYGISCILIFVGFKMLASHYYEIGTGVSLAVIGGILLATIVASVLRRS